MWSHFKNSLITLQNICFPLKAIRSNSTKKTLWWNAELKKS